MQRCGIWSTWGMRWCRRWTSIFIKTFHKYHAWLKYLLPSIENIQMDLKMWLSWVMQEPRYHPSVWVQSPCIPLHSGSPWNRRDCVSLEKTQSAMICWSSFTVRTLGHILYHILPCIQPLAQDGTNAGFGPGLCCLFATRTIWQTSMGVYVAEFLSSCMVSILFLCHQCIMDLSICTSLMNPFSIFRCAASSFSMFLYSSLHSVKYSVCIFSLDSQPGCAAIQSWMTRVW